MKDTLKEKIKAQLHEAADMQYKCMSEALDGIRVADPSLTDEQQEKTLQAAVEAAVQGVVKMSDSMSLMLREKMKDPGFIEEVKKSAGVK